MWAATCSSPARTPLDNSQLSPLQQVSLTSITARRVFVSLDKSLWLSRNEIWRPKNDCVSDPVIEGGDPGREEVVEVGDRLLGKVKWVGRKARLKAGVDRTAAASRLFTIRSARMQILCHCSMRGTIFPRTTLPKNQKKMSFDKDEVHISYANFSSRSLGIDISSILSTRLETDSSSKEMGVCLRHISKDGSDRKTASTPSSLIMGWFL